MTRYMATTRFALFIFTLLTITRWATLIVNSTVRIVIAHATRPARVVVIGRAARGAKR